MVFEAGFASLRETLIQCVEPDASEVRLIVAILLDRQGVLQIVGFPSPGSVQHLALELSAAFCSRL